VSAPVFSPAAAAWLESHAVAGSTAGAYGVRELDGALLFPYVAADGARYSRRRDLATGAVLQPKGRPLDPWWPICRPDDAEAVLVCEGEGDALAAVSALLTTDSPDPGARAVLRDCAPKVCAVPGAGFAADRLARELRDVGCLQAWIAFDGDDAGRRATAKACEALRAARITPLVVQVPEGRDVAECLAAADDRPRWLAEALIDAQGPAAEGGVSPAARPVADLQEHAASRAREGIPWSDYGNAERLVQAHGEDLLHVTGLGWHVWEGRRYRRDDDGEVMRRAKASARALREEAAALESGEEANKLFAHATKSESRPRLEAAVALAATELKVVCPADALDADPFLLNCPNGTVDLRSGELRDHCRDDRITKLAGAPYEPDAGSPRWLELLATALEGDEELIAFTQRAVGYSMTGDTREQCLFILHGEGANGKTTFLNGIGDALGDYATAADSSTFLGGRAGGGPRPDVTRLRGARFVRSAEVEADARLAEVFVKQATGGDTLVARSLYRDEFEFRPQLKLWIAANHLPAIRGTDHAIWRRLRRIPFEHTVSRPDRTLPDKLRDELPGILAWAVQGCLAWQQEGLGIPARVKEATESYREAQDSIGAFLREHCRLDPHVRTGASELRDAYGRWCNEQGLQPIAAGPFKAAVEGYGARWKKVTEGRFYEGIEVAK